MMWEGTQRRIDPSRVEEMLRKAQRTRLKWTALYGLIGVYLGCVFVVIADHRINTAFVQNFPPKDAIGNSSGDDVVLVLPDLGFEHIGYIDVPEVSEFWVLLGVMLTMARFVCTSLGVTVMRRWIFCAGTLAMLRGFSRMLTVSPAPGSNCDGEVGDFLNISGGIFWQAFLVLMRRTSTCASVMFSLHVVHLTLCGMVWLYYSESNAARWPGAEISEPLFLSPGERVIKAAVILYILVGYYLILATRAHYTASLVIWAFLSALLWIAYHQWIVLLRLNQVLPNRFCTETIFGSWVSWFEFGSADLEFTELSRLQIDQTKDGSVHSTFYLPRTPSIESSEDDPEYDSAFQSSAQAPLSHSNSNEHRPFLAASNSRSKFPTYRSTLGAGKYESFTPLD